MKSRLDDLNPAQREAVMHRDGPLLVLAGPGSGKTRVVVHRLAQLLQSGVAPHHLVAMTFTNKAADTMKTRLAQLVPGRYVWMGTFHKFCVRLLREYDHADCLRINPQFSIYDTDDAAKLLASFIDKNSLRSGITIPRIQSAISRAKNQMVLPHEYEAHRGSSLGAAVADFYPQYQEALRKNNAVDFDDILLYVAILLRDFPEIRTKLDQRHRYILVDEYQDTNAVQYSIVKLLSRDYPNLAVTGDPDQSIYGWRGADIGNILNFEHDFPQTKVVKLECNYRSTPEIVRAAGELIRRNTQRKEKELFTHNHSGAQVRLDKYMDQQSEADLIAHEIAQEIFQQKRAPRDFAILYRINALSRNLEFALRRAKVPFRLVRGLEFYARAEIKDILAYLKLIANPSHDVAFSRIINVPARGIGKSTQEIIHNVARENDLSLLDALAHVLEIRRFTPKTTRSLREFQQMMDTWQSAAGSMTLESLVSEVLKKTNYRAQFQVEVSEKVSGTHTESDNEHLANIEELLTAARDFDTHLVNEDETATPLEQFLEQTALVSDTDSLTGDNCVSLMSLHAAKGLEFPVVYLIAVEEGILPIAQAQFQEDEREEERRLLFVGMTRAENELRLSSVETRAFRGNVNAAIESSFLFDIPKDCLVIQKHAEENGGKFGNKFSGKLGGKFSGAKSHLRPENDGIDAVYNDDGCDDEYDEDGNVIPRKKK